MASEEHPVTISNYDNAAETYPMTEHDSGIDRNGSSTSKRRPSSDSGVVGDDAAPSGRCCTRASTKIHTFGDSTSMHGLGRALGDGPIWRRLIWAIVVICFAVKAGNTVYDIVQDFFRHPVTSTMNSQYQGKMNFPAVTICNLNRIRKSMAPENVLQEIQTSMEILKNDAKARVSEEHKFIDKVVKNLTWEKQLELGHQIEDMLFSCKFGSEDCDHHNFSRIFNLRYGNCYTFASIGLDRENWTTVKAGPSNGLVLEMNIQAEEYLAISSKSGIKIIVHDKKEYPFPEDGGLTAGPGYFTNVAIRQTDFHRLSHPYGNCLDIGEHSEDIRKNLYAGQGYSYSLNACHRSCFQQYIYKHCNCCDSALPCEDDALQKATGKKTDDDTIPFCNSGEQNEEENEEQYCVEEADDLFSDDQMGCNEFCPPACHEHSFLTSVSSGDFPADAHARSLAERIKTWGKAGTITDYDKFFEKSFLRLEVYYDALILETVETQPAYTYEKLLGDIGGQLGLFLGFSILTALEIVELLIVDLGFGLGLGWLFGCKKGRKSSEKSV